MILFRINGEASPAQPRRAAERCRSPTGRAAPGPTAAQTPRGAAPAPPPPHSGTAPHAPGRPGFPGRGEEEQEEAKGSSRWGWLRGQGAAVSLRRTVPSARGGLSPPGWAALHPAEGWAGAGAHLRSRIPHAHTLPGCPSCRPARSERLFFPSVVFVRGSWPVWGQVLGWFARLGCFFPISCF